MHFLAIGNLIPLLFYKKKKKRKRKGRKKTLLSYNACNLSNHRYIIILNLPRVFNNLHGYTGHIFIALRNEELLAKSNILLYSTRYNIRSSHEVESPVVEISSYVPTLSGRATMTLAQLIA